MKEVDKMKKFVVYSLKRKRGETYQTYDYIEAAGFEIHPSGVLALIDENGLTIRAFGVGQWIEVKEAE